MAFWAFDSDPNLGFDCISIPKGVRIAEQEAAKKCLAAPLLREEYIMKPKLELIAKEIDLGFM